MAKATKTTAMTKWDEKMAQLAGQYKQSIDSAALGGMFIATAGGIMKYKGAEVPNNQMDVVVVDWIFENDFFLGKFEPDKPVSPVCYAFGRIQKEMAPHADCYKKQSDVCKTCHQNEWGTADVGKGKACQNRVRMAMVSVADLKDVASAEVAYLRVPVTSVQAWLGHARQVTELYGAPFAVVTRLKCEKDPKFQFKIIPSLVKPIEDKTVLGSLLEKNEEVAKTIDFKYPDFVEPASGNGRKPAASKAKTARRSKF